MSIISIKHKFIFLKTRKVAGTSIEAELRKLTGEDDIVPAVTPRDEYHSAKDGYHSRNYLAERGLEEHYTSLVMAKRFEEAAEYLASHKPIAPSHMKYPRIESIVRTMGYNIDDFFVFTVDRHPYSWVLSSALYNNAEYNRKGEDIKNWTVREINNLVRKHLNRDAFFEKANWNLYSDGNEILVDKVLKYEELNSQLSDLYNKYGWKFNGLPELKTNSRHLDAMEVIDKENKDVIFHKLKHVFVSLGYER